MKRFHHDIWLQLYMYYFMYVDTEKISEEEYSPDTIIFVQEYKKR